MKEAKKLQIDKAIIGLQQFFVTHKLSDVERSMMGLESYYDHCLDSMIIKLRRDVVAQKLEPKLISHTKYVIAYVPDTWWDHFKYTYRYKWWMPKFLRKWENRKVVLPARFRVKVEPMYLFPDAVVSLPNDGTTVKFANITWE